MDSLRSAPVTAMNYPSLLLLLLLHRDCGDECARVSLCQCVCVVLGRFTGGSDNPPSPGYRGCVFVCDVKAGGATTALCCILASVHQSSLRIHTVSSPVTLGSSTHRKQTRTCSSLLPPTGDSVVDLAHLMGFLSLS